MMFVRYEEGEEKERKGGGSFVCHGGTLPGLATVTWFFGFEFARP
jgi:hypothetical protein